MSAKSSDEKYASAVYWQVFSVAVILILLSLLLQAGFKPTDDSFLKAIFSFMKELGTAGLIATIMIFTIERFTRERHQKAADDLVEKINKNLFDAVYHRYIPPAVFEEIDKCLMKSGIFRTGHELSYTLDIKPEKDMPDVPNTLSCLAESSYVLRNTTNSRIKHDVVSVLERPIDKRLDTFTRPIKVEIGNKIFLEDEIEAHTEITHNHIIFKFPIEIPPNGQTRVSTSSRLIKRKEDMEVWASRLPSDGLKLTVNAPNSNIEVNASANHFEEIKPIGTYGLTKKWELPHGIFPYQSIVFWWLIRVPKERDS